LSGLACATETSGAHTLMPNRLSFAANGCPYLVCWDTLELTLSGAIWEAFAFTIVSRSTTSDTP